MISRHSAPWDILGEGGRGEEAGDGMGNGGNPTFGTLGTAPLVLLLPLSSPGPLPYLPSWRGGERGEGRGGQRERRRLREVMVNMRGRMTNGLFPTALQEEGQNDQGLPPACVWGLGRGAAGEG